MCACLFPHEGVIRKGGPLSYLGHGKVPILSEGGRNPMKPSAARVAKKWKNLPPGWTDKSVKKFWKTLGKGTPEHKVWDCIEKMTDAKSYWKGKIKKKKKGSTNTEREFYKASDGKWYVDNEDYQEDEDGYQIEGDMSSYGPFMSEEAAEKYMRDNFANSGSSWTDKSGRRKPPRNPIKPRGRRRHPTRRWASTPNAASVALRWSMRS